MEQPHNGDLASREDKDEILRKVGRNVMLFQRAERLLKWLAAHRRIAGMSDEILDTAARLREQVAGETLGTVMRRTIDELSLSAREQEMIDAAIIEKGCIHMEISFDFTGADGEPDVAWREELETLVKHRNDLVHHFLERFDLESADGCRAASLYLDQQHAKHVPLVVDLRRRCESVATARNILFAALKQEDIRSEFLHGHLRPDLDQILRHVAAQKARADGWTFLSLAGKALADEAPWLLKHLEDAFGSRGLKQAVAALDGWQLTEEPTKGGMNVLYRSADPHPTVE